MMSSIFLLWYSYTVRRSSICCDINKGNINPINITNIKVEL